MKFWTQSSETYLTSAKPICLKCRARLVFLISWMQSHEPQHKHHLNLCAPALASAQDRITCTVCVSVMSLIARFQHLHTAWFQLQLHRRCEPAQTFCLDLYVQYHQLGAYCDVWQTMQGPWERITFLCVCQLNSMPALLFNYTPREIHMCVFLQRYKAERNTTRLNWRGEVSAKGRCSLASWRRFTFSSRRACVQR